MSLPADADEWRYERARAEAEDFEDPGGDQGERDDRDVPDCPAEVHDREGDPCICCPECDEGVVVSYGSMERDTGHYPVGCSANCGWRT